MSEALDLIDRARTDAANIAAELLGPPNKALSTRAALKWGNKGSVSLTISGAQAGKWRDWQSGEHGDVLDLVKRETGRDQTEALRWLGDYYGGSPLLAVDHAKREQERAAAQAADAAEREAKEQAAADLWKGSLPLEGTPAEAYLLRRLCGFPIPRAVIEGGALRWHPGCRTFKGEPIPGAIGAMLCKMTDARTGKGVGVHRTFLDADAGKLARGMLGTKGVARLWPDDSVTTGLAIGEGIETVLSGALLLDARPAWAALDAGALAGFPVLDGIEALTILSDNDAPDQKGRRAGPLAAQQCAQTWLAAGREVTVKTPRETDLDFNSMLTALMHGDGKAAA